jgi:hypothetical protein
MRIRKACQELEIGGTGNREKTNPCGAVKPEIAGDRPVNGPPFDRIVIPPD